MRLSFIFVLITAILLSWSCKEEKVDIEKVVKEIDQNSKRKKIKPPVKKTENNIKQNNENSLVALIVKQLPKLETGMDTDTVFSLLYLDTKFNGIVSSAGERDDFTYYYELTPGHELRLHFDYTAEENGSFTKYKLLQNS